MPTVNVPQESGEIRISRAGDEPEVYKVTNGHVTLKADEVEAFLAVVDGAEEASPKKD